MAEHGLAKTLVFFRMGGLHVFHCEMQRLSFVRKTESISDGSFLTCFDDFFFSQPNMIVCPHVSMKLCMADVAEIWLNGARV